MRLTHNGVLVLKACMDQAGKQLHGYELMQLTGLASGTIYPVLMRFEDAGWLTSSWEAVDPKEEGRPRRRLYRITGAGAAMVSSHFARLGVVLA